MLKLFIFLLLGAIAAEENPCATNNGGCSHECIWSSGFAHYCACRCGYMLVADNFTCEPDYPCDIDLYIGVDVASGDDVPFCSPTSTATVSQPYIEYRDFASNFLANFLDRASTDRWNIGFQLYYTNSDTQNLTFFQNNNFSDGLLTFNETMGPKCGTPLYPNYQFRLSRVVPNNSAVRPRYVNESPGDYRIPENTTYIALLISTGNYVPLSSNEAERILKAPHDFFDDIVLIVGNQNELLVDRFTACGNGTAPCPNVFYRNAENDFDRNLTIDNFDDVIDLNSCVKRRPLPSVPEAVVTCSPAITIYIPTCLLLGLRLEHLQFNDDSCNLRDYATETSSGYEISIPSFKCGSLSQEESGYYIVTQTIFTRDFGNLSSISFLSFPIRCVYPVRVTEPPNGFEDVAVGESDTTDDQVDFYASLKENMQPRLENSDCVEVNCPVYFKIDTTVTSPYTVALDSCHATFSPNPNASPRYDIVDDGCPLDATFSYITPSLNTSVCFTFNMFEWGETLNEKESDKLPVYIHCTLFACVPEVPCAALDCDDGGSGKRRRSLNEEDSRSTTFGPLYVSRKKQGGVEEIDRKDTVFIVEVPAIESYGSKLLYQSVWLLIAAAMLVFVIKKLMNKFAEDDLSSAVLVTNKEKKALDVKHQLLM